MPEVMVDSNVLLDVLTSDPRWGAWSEQMLQRYAESQTLVINPIVYAEVSVAFEHIQDVEAAIPESLVQRRSIPMEAAFLAAKCFRRYRQAGGDRRSVLPDFFIGAHALVSGMSLLSRDKGRYATYFPRLPLICPSGT
jgi:predicted nucleic acid-binding protein